MTEKVKVTQEQFRALEHQKKQAKYFSQERVIRIHVQHDDDWSDEFKGLNKMPLLKLVDALRIGYEIEPKYKIGEWVRYWKSDSVSGIGKINEIQYGHGRVHYEGVSGWKSIRDIDRKANPEEFKAEKERRKWAKIGRKVGEFKYSDIGYDWEGLLITSDDLKETYESGDLQGFYREEDFISFGDGDTNA